MAKCFRTPPNCEFQVDDAEQPWTFDRNHFDFIHCRDMYVGIRNWKRFIRQCYNHVKPGGWVEIASVYPMVRSDDGTLPPDSAWVELSQAFLDIGLRMDSDPEYQLKLKAMFKEVGFESVHETIMKIPSSSWAKDPLQKKIGSYEMVNIIEGSANFLHRCWTKDMGKTDDDIAMMSYRLKSELKTNKMHCYVP
jgi:hypothetical protein